MMDQPGDVRAGSPAGKPKVQLQESGFQSSDSATGSGFLRVQFDAGTKDRDGSERKVKRINRSFKDIVMNDVIGTDSGGSPESTSGFSSKRGILKTRSDPVLSKDSEKQSLCFVNKAYDGEDPDSTNTTTAGTANSDGIATTTRSAFPFSLNRLARASSYGNVLAEVVEMLFHRTSLDCGNRDMHPFGRDCSAETIADGNRPKRHSKNSAFSKLVIWITLLSLLVGAAAGVIFLSETYNEKRRQSMLLAALRNETLDMS